MQKARTALKLALGVAPILLGGCMLAAVGAGAAGTVAYVKGDLEVVEPKDTDAVYQATKKATEQLGLVVTEDTRDNISATIVARDSADKKITIKLGAAAEDSTKLSIRYSLFGNETKSRVIHDKIRENLK